MKHPLLLLAVGFCCARAPVAVPRESVEPQAARAEQAIGALRARLLARLAETLGEGGPAHALTVCSQEAASLTSEIGRAQGIEVGRTSFKLRNPANAPRAWAAATVAAADGARAADARAAFFDLGDKVGVLAPMPVGALCLNCHGPQPVPEVANALRARYPDDRATGFSEGDLRGFFWAEVPKG